MNITTVFWMFLIGYGLLSLVATLIVISAIVQAARVERLATGDPTPGKTASQISLCPLPKRAPMPTLYS